MWRRLDQHATIRRDLLFGADCRGMDTIIIRYQDNDSVLYDGKEYVESLSKVYVLYNNGYLTDSYIIGTCTPVCAPKYAENRVRLERYRLVTLRVSW